MNEKKTPNDSDKFFLQGKFEMREMNASQQSFTSSKFKQKLAAIDKGHRTTWVSYENNKWWDKQYEKEMGSNYFGNKIGNVNMKIVNDFKMKLTK